MTPPLGRHVSQKPLLGQRLDRTQSLTLGLLQDWCLLEGSGGLTIDLASGDVGTLASTMTWAATPLGAGPQSSLAIASYVTIPVPHPTLAQGPLSLDAWVHIPTTSDHGCFIKIGNSSTGIGLGVGATSFETAGNIILVLIEGVAWNISAISAGTGIHHILATLSSNGKTTTVYLDGRQRYSTTLGVAMVSIASAAALCGYNAGATNRTFSGTLLRSRVWNRTLSADDAFQLSLSPFGLVQEPNYRRWLAAGSTAYTRSLSSAISHSAAVARTETLTRAQSSTVAHTAAVARSEALTRTQSSSIAQTATVARAQVLARAQSSSVAHSAALTRTQTVVRGLSSAIIHVANLARAQTVARGLSSAIAHVATVARSQVLGRALSSAIGHMATVSTGHAMMRALSSSIAHAAAVTRAQASVRSLTSSISHSPIVTRGQALTRALALSIAHLATVVGAPSLTPLAVAAFIARPLATQWQATSLLRSWLAASLLSTWRARRR